MGSGVQPAGSPKEPSLFKKIAAVVDDSIVKPIESVALRIIGQGWAADNIYRRKERGDILGFVFLSKKTKEIFKSQSTEKKVDSVSSSYWSFFKKKEKVAPEKVGKTAFEEVREVSRYLLEGKEKIDSSQSSSLLRRISDMFDEIIAYLMGTALGDDPVSMNLQGYLIGGCCYGMTLDRFSEENREESGLTKEERVAVIQITQGLLCGLQKKRGTVGGDGYRKCTEKEKEINERTRGGEKFKKAATWKSTLGFSSKETSEAQKTKEYHGFAEEVEKEVSREIAKCEKYQKTLRENLKAVLGLTIDVSPHTKIDDAIGILNKGQGHIGEFNIDNLADQDKLIISMSSWENPVAHAIQIDLKNFTIYDMNTGVHSYAEEVSPKEALLAALALKAEEYGYDQMQIGGKVSNSFKAQTLGFFRSVKDMVSDEFKTH